MREIMRVRVFSLSVTMLVLSLFTQSSNAVPSFARRYQQSCTTCHTVFPALNEYGRLFRAKGYRLPGAAGTIVGEEPIGLGTEVKSPGAKRPLEIPFVDIPATSVASFQVTSDYVNRPDDAVTDEFTGISSVGLIFGGAMGTRFSFFGNIAIIEDGAFEGIDRLFFQYNRDLAFNVRVGQFEPRAIPFSNHRRLIRITPYLNGVFPIVPAHNFFGFSPNQKGIEAFGRIPGPGSLGEFEYAAGLINGEPGGAFEALEGTGGMVGELVENLEEAYEDSGGENDFNNSKDFYGRLNYNLWLRGAFSVGSFYYKGKSGFLADTADPDSFVKNGNNFNRWGVDLRWNQDRGYVTFLSSVQFFNDSLDRATFNDLSARVTTGEIQLHVRPWLVPAFRYERVDLYDFPSTFSNSFDRYSVEFLAQLAPNIMIMAGTTRSSNSAPELPLFDSFSRVAVHFAF